jgi:hypothetical protein
MDTGQVERILKDLEEISLKFVKVRQGAPADSTFSALSQTLRFDSIYADMSFQELFSITKDTLTRNCCKGSDLYEAIGRLHAVYSDSTVLNSLVRGWLREPHEGGQLWYTATHVLYPLTNMCTLGRDVRKNITTPLASVPDVQGAHIGIGKEGIWRGSPDAMCRVVPIEALKNLIKDSSSDSVSSNASSRAMCEGKVDFLGQDLMQVCGQSVVTSYISKNVQKRNRNGNT